jgi:hypothetical protein
VLVALPQITEDHRRCENEEQIDEQTKVGSKNSMKSDSNQNETLPNFAQIKFNMLRIYPQEIID